MCHSSHKNAQAIPVRPHHGMCLAFFIGKGYSEGFSAHMEKMLKEFQKNLPVRLVVHTDEICSACPNNEKNVCKVFLATSSLGLDGSYTIDKRDD